MMQQYDKMILAILQGDDYHDAVHSLNEHGFYATVLNSSGGFLKSGWRAPAWTRRWPS